VIATLTNIAISNGNTKACIKDTNSSCKYIKIGTQSGNCNHTIPAVIQPNATYSITIRVAPDVILPNSLNESDTIFANVQITSSNHKNNDKIISNTFIIAHAG
jgi:hypothetical protein